MNPYLETPSAVHSESHTQEILDVATQRQTPIGGSSIVIMLTGSGRRQEERKILVRAADGRLINPEEQIYKCLCGCENDLLTRHSVFFCGLCQSPVYLTHGKVWDDGLRQERVCPPCWRPGWFKRAIRRFLRELTRL